MIQDIERLIRTVRAAPYQVKVGVARALADHIEAVEKENRKLKQMFADLSSKTGRSRISSKKSSNADIKT